MHTSIVLIALAGTAVGSNTVSTEVNWRGDYREALREGRSGRKPLAVFVGSGNRGWDALTGEGRLSSVACDLLKTEYVCVYVDLDRSSGRKLAEEFELSNGPGLVLSDRDGDVQAYRHEGALNDAELRHQLRRFSDPHRVVLRTESGEESSIRFYAPPAPAAPALAPPLVPSFPAQFGFPMGGFSGGFSGGRSGGC